MLLGLVIYQLPIVSQKGHFHQWTLISQLLCLNVQNNIRFRRENERALKQLANEVNETKINFKLPQISRCAKQETFNSDVKINDLGNSARDQNITDFQKR